MNFLKRAFLSIWGHKAKTIILFVAFAVIGSMLLGSLAIQNTSKQIVNQAKKDIGCKISVLPQGDTEKPMYLRIENDYYSEVQKLKHITCVNRIQSMLQIAKSFKVDGDTSENYAHDFEINGVTLTSVTDTSEYSGFASGKYKLVEGRHLNKSDTGKNVVMIDKTVADSNKIKLGDTIITTRHQGSQCFVSLDSEGTDCSYVVVGIFTSFNNNGGKSYWDDPTKSIFTSDNPNCYLGETTESMRDFSKATYNSDVDGVKKIEAIPAEERSYFDKEALKTYKSEVVNFQYFPNYYPLTYDDLKEAKFLELSVDSPENIKSVINNLKYLDKKNIYQFDSYADDYNRIITPINTAKKLTTLFTYVIFGAGLLIMALIVILSLRSRKREFGILLAMGEKKFKVILQVLLETLVPVILSFMVAFFASGFLGNLAAQKIVSDSYQPFDNKITNTDTNKIKEIQSRETLNTSFNIKSVEQINKIDVSVTPADVGIFAGCSLLIVILASAIPMIKIVKLSPMNVLTHKD